MDEPSIEQVVAWALADAARELRLLTKGGRLHLLGLTIESRAEWLASRLDATGQRSSLPGQRKVPARGEEQGPPAPTGGGASPAQG